MSVLIKRAVCSLAALTAIILAVVFFTSPGATARLLDGTEVTLQNASYGTNQTAPRAPLQDLLGRLPTKWSELIGWHSGSAKRNVTKRPVFTFWLKFSSQAGTTQTIDYAIADESGLEAPMIFDGFYGTYSPGGFSKDQAGLVRSSSTLPRRSRKLFLRIYQRDGNGRRVRVGEFPVRNDAVTKSPGWSPQSLPAECQTNGLGLALLKAEVGGVPPGAEKPPYDSQTGEWSEFRFRVGQPGKPHDGWTINEMIISDGAGNQVRVSGEDKGAIDQQLSHLERDEIVCLHRWNFWADESAWRLSVHFEQSATNGCWTEYLVRPKFLKLPRSPNTTPVP